MEDASAKSGISMNWVLTASVGLLVIAALIHFTIEVVYFVRMILCYILAKFLKRKIHILEKCAITGICTTKDVDMILTHMNNARYLREVDMARIDFYIRSRLYDVVRSQKGQILLGACNVRFRRFIGIFQRFKITTKILYWNEENIFIEHRFVGRDGFIHCTLLCQQRLVNCSGETVMDILLKQGSTMLTKPEMPMEVLKFLELQDVSKKTLASNDV